jgi:hypothetical protein
MQVSSASFGTRGLHDFVNNRICGHVRKVHVMITRTLTGENIPPKTGVSVPTHQEESARMRIMLERVALLHCCS